MKKLLLCLISLAILGCSEEKPPVLRQVEGEMYSKRGEMLVKGLAACGYCHGQTSSPEAPLTGGRAVIDRYGEVNAPNITASKTGIAGWTTTDIMQGVRNSVDRDENDLSQDVHRGYLWMADEDLLSIVGYLRSLQPFENEVDRRHVSFISRNTTGFWETRKKVSGVVPPVPRRERAAYGGYLVDHVAQCGFCHNSPSTLLSGEGYLAGGKRTVAGDEEKAGPALDGSPVSAIASWGEGNIVQYLKTGITPAGKQVDPRFCPTNFYRNAGDADLGAVAAYLKTVPAP